MAWFVQAEYKDSELGTYYSPSLADVPGEPERFRSLAEELGKEIEAQYMAGPRDRDTPGYPFFGTSTGPRLREGWRFPIPELPFREQLKTPQDDIVDIIGSRFGGYAISDRVINLIEEIEPGVHQYLPYELVTPDGSTHPAKRWLLNVCTRAEVVDVEKSNVGWSAGAGPRWFAELPGKKHIVVKAEEAARRATWCEWRFNAPSLQMVVSDRLYDDVKSAGMRGWQPHHIHPYHLDEI